MLEVSITLAVFGWSIAAYQSYRLYQIRQQINKMVRTTLETFKRIEEQERQKTDEFLRSINERLN